MSNVNTVGAKLVELCREGKALNAVRELYADDIVSVEAAGGGGFDQVMKGKDAVLSKGTWWEQNHEVHEAGVTGPFPHGDDRFAVIFDYDVTFKPDKRRQRLEEVAVYHVADGKIVREEFYYSAPPAA